jgi:hypothetical protein
MTHPSPADTGTAVGKVYGYALYPTAAPSSKFTITGSVALGEFGHGIAAAGSFVVIAAPDAQGKTISIPVPVSTAQYFMRFITRAMLETASVHCKLSWGAKLQRDCRHGGTPKRAG